MTARSATGRPMTMGHRLSVFCLGVIAWLSPLAAHARETAGSEPLSVLLLIAALSLLPFVLVVTTGFVKIVVVLSILRNALGTPQVPPTIVVTSLAIILTAYVMAPTAMEAYDAARGAAPAGKQPAAFFSLNSARSLFEAADKGKEPVRAFLWKQSHAGDRALFRQLARRLWPEAQRESLSDRHFAVIVPAFVIGQLAAAFKIGFLLFVPFLVLDLVVANILLALGMHMLSPTTIALPFKLLLFVLVDGWQLLTRGLLLSFG